MYRKIVALFVAVLFMFAPVAQASNDPTIYSTTSATWVTVGVPYIQGVWVYNGVTSVRPQFFVYTGGALTFNSATVVENNTGVSIFCGYNATDQFVNCRPATSIPANTYYKVNISFTPNCCVGTNVINNPYVSWVSGGNTYTTYNGNVTVYVAQ